MEVHALSTFHKNADTKPNTEDAEEAEDGLSRVLENTIDKETKAKRDTTISELTTIRITKAKAKVKFGVTNLCGHECERSSVQLISLRKRKRQNIFGKLISL